MDIKVTKSASEDIKSLSDRERGFLKRAIHHIRRGETANVRRIAGEDDAFVARYNNLRVYFIKSREDDEVVVVAVEQKRKADERRRDWVQSRITETA